MDDEAMVARVIVLVEHGHAAHLIGEDAQLAGTVHVAVALEDDGATVEKEDAGCDSGDWENDGNEARGKKRKRTLEEEDKDGCVEDDMVAAGVLPEIDPNRPLPRWAVDAASDEITEEEKLAVPEFFCGRYIVVIASRSCICMCMSCRMRICALWMFTQARCLPQAGPSIYAHK